MARTIAVAGKGGTGKTTVAALIIRHLRKHGEGPILAMDADPDANLGTVLGIATQGSIGDLREDLLKKMKDFPAGMSKQSYIEAGLHQIIAETEGMDFIAMGRSEGPGCYCYINNVLRKFAQDVSPAYRWVVMDNEAGLEHLSRRTAARVDALVVVLNESPLAIDCARRIEELVKSIPNEVHKKFYVINAVREERLSAVRARAAGLGLEFLGAVPHDAALEELLFKGRPVAELNGSPAKAAIDRILDKIKEG
jgi:CO dehydrogenase maturation factor